MYLEVYPDVIFILNFYLDFIILSILKKINRKDSSIIRRMFAAAAGGIAAVVMGVYPWIDSIIRFLLLNIVTAFLMIFVAFGRMKRWDVLKQLVSLYLLTYAIGGFLNSLYYYTNIRQYVILFGQIEVTRNVSIGFLLCSLLFLLPVILLFIQFFGWLSNDKQELMEIELYQGENKVQTVGLLDSGNNLYDPIFRKPVIIIEKNLLPGLLSAASYESIDLVIRMMERTEAGVGIPEPDGAEQLHLKMIPYQSIGKKHGIMPGLIIDKLLIHKGKETICNEHVTAAICENSLSAKEEYRVILHRNLL